MTILVYPFNTYPNHGNMYATDSTEQTYVGTTRHINLFNSPLAKHHHILLISYGQT